MKSAVPIEYNFDIRSVVMTILVFMVIFLLNSIKAYRIIYKFKLIELIHASKEGEKQPKFSKALAILSILMVVFGYFGAFIIDAESGGIKMVYEGLVVIILVILGTYLLFNNLIIYLLKLFEKNKRVYYKGENLIGVSQIIYRIKGNSNLLATIAVVSSVAITALCFTFSFSMFIEKVGPNGSPFSVMFEGSNEKINKSVEEVINNNNEIKVTYKKDYVMINGSGLTDKYKGPFGRDLKGPFDMYIMSESEYKDILSNSGFNRGTDIVDRVTDIEISKKNQCFFIEVSSLASGRRRLAGDKLNATINDEAYEFDISDSDVRCVLGSEFQKATIVVPDITFNKLLKDNKNLTIIRTYNFDKELKSGKVVKELRQIIPNGSPLSSYYDIYTSTHTLYGSYVFIGIFIGILFVISTGSIMYYKQLTEAHEDKDRYSILSKIGLSTKETLRIISKQLGFIFVMPLLFAILNSMAALGAYLKYCGWSLALIEYVGGTIVVYVLIYLCFYLLSVKSYMRIIKRNAVY
ncbi:FtsX-like permease family protein [Clostridium sp. C2-6-12]|uniref:FtsX-like permease family protein n=1 Tax=Clostridium sp. C2-6-12 TaxID=2698832 RepID=UPI001FAC7179|nr:FtsX-like permease family protein [Clostridium sp. C2-6-12]